MWRYFISLIFATCFSLSQAFAINGGVAGSSDLAAQTVFIVSTRGSYCSGAVIARDLVITAAHCVQPSANYAVTIQDNGTPRVVQVLRIELHPLYDPKQFETRKPSPDLAILKLSEPFPAGYQSAKIAVDTVLPIPGTPYLLAGFGFAIDGDERTLGKLRSVTLPAIGTTGGIMVRLSAGKSSSAGACTGDSGGPAFRGDVLAAVIGWIDTPAGRHCGSVTGATLVALQRDWIASTARALGGDIRD